MKTGNTGQPGVGRGRDLVASMEPGHEDREYSTPGSHRSAPRCASMEPGHEDREYTLDTGAAGADTGRASMEPGHEDREYEPQQPGSSSLSVSLNGARS